MLFLIILMRIVTAMALLLFLTLKTGRRKISEMPVYDFLTVIVIGSVIGADISEPDVAHLPILFAVVVLILLQQLISRVLINHKTLAKHITFGPTIVLQNGELLKGNLERLKYPVENITMALREQGIFDLSEVEYAILESSGKISVLKKAPFLPATPYDMKIPSSSKGLSIPLITDGNVHTDNLTLLRRDEPWLLEQLRLLGISAVSEVFYASINAQGKLFVSKILQTTDVQDSFTL